MTEIHVGDIISAKKKHPCGSDEWIVLRAGPIYVFAVQDVVIF